MKINIVSIAVYAVIGLFVGAMFSDHISMNLAATDWTNLWTYGWIWLWPVFLAVKFLELFLIVAGTVGIVMIAHYQGNKWGWW